MPPLVRPPSSAPIFQQVYAYATYNQYQNVLISVTFIRDPLQNGMFKLLLQRSETWAQKYGRNDGLGVVR